jgi:UDP-glucose 4-epimerase
MKKILVTGGAGFIGYHLTQKILGEKDVSVVIVDNLQRGRMDHDFEELLKDKRIVFINGDLTSIEFYKNLATDFDEVYHLAAVNGTKWFYKMPEEVMRINTLSTVYILEWIKNLQKKPKICFTSSNEAYAGAISVFEEYSGMFSPFIKLPIPTPENVPLVIEDTYNPRWTYASTKLVGEMFLIHYAQAFSIPAFIVRPHNFYGPRAGFDHVIPEMSKRIIEKEDPFVVFGADETRTFCYIDDAVEAMTMLMASNKTNSFPIETFHIGTKKEISMGKLAEKMLYLTGYKPTNMEVKPGLKGSVKRRLADTSKINDFVGWTPKVPLDEGLQMTFEWYKDYYSTNK